MLVKIYDHSSPSYFDGFIENYHRRNCIHYASDIFKDTFYSEELEINIAVKKAISVCRTLNIAIAENFVSVYRAIGDEVYLDWKLSPLGVYFSLLNGNPASPIVAKFQMMLYEKKMQSKS